MKIKHILFIFLSIITLTGLFPYVNAAAQDNEELNLPDFPNISSRNVVLMDADSGEVLYSSNPDTQCAPASTTKLLTALLTVENCSMNDTVTFSKAAVNSIEYGDANAGISVGEQMTVEQALYCLILRSANDVAYGLAEHVSGNVSTFASLMNTRAEQLGAVNTHFTNASGLTDEFHYTTPYDMALIAKACFNNKNLMKIVGYSGVYTIAPTNTNNYTRYYTHRYKMLPGGDYAYKYSCGGKTGYTDAAGNCLVSFAQKDDLRLICVIMNSTDDLRYKDTIALYDYYFENYKKIFLDDYDTGLSVGNVDILELTQELDSSLQTTIGFQDKAYLLVPKKVSMSDLTGIVTYPDNKAYVGAEGGFACISFYYSNINVGNATVFVTTQDNSTIIPGESGVPLALDSFRTSSEKYFFINIWYVAGGILALAAITGIIIYLLKRNHRRSGYGSKKLHF